MKKEFDKNASPWGIYKRDPGALFAYSFLTLLFFLLSVGLYFLIGGMLPIFFLLLACPALFAALFMMTDNEESPINIRFYFLAFFAYFKPPFRGVFKAILSFLKSLGFSLAIVTVMSIVYYLVSPTFDPGFQETFLTFYEFYMKGDQEAMIALVEQSESIKLFFSVFYPIFDGSFIFLMVHFVYVGAIEVIGRADVPRVVAEGTTIRVYSDSARTIRKKYAGLYWKKTWFILVIAILLFLSGILIGLQFTKDGLAIAAIGFGLSGFFYSLMLPYHAEVLRLLFNEKEEEIYIEAVRRMKILFQEVRARGTENIEDITRFEENLKRLEESLQDGSYKDNRAFTDERRSNE